LVGLGKGFGEGFESVTASEMGSVWSGEIKRLGFSSAAENHDGRILKRLWSTRGQFISMA